MELDLAKLAAWNNACSADILANGDGVTPRTLVQSPVSELSAGAGCPLISLLICCAGADDGSLSATLASLACNDLGDIQTVLVIGGELSGDPMALRAPADLAHQIEIHAASDESLPILQQIALSFAQGTFVGFLTPGDILTAGSLALLKHVIRNECSADILYSDEIWLDGGQLIRPRLKTGWDPDAQLGRDHFGRMCLLRRRIVIEVGGILPVSEPAQEYDLNCRVAFSIPPTAIKHIPEILCHRTVPAVEAGEQAPLLERFYHAARNVAKRAAERLCGMPVSVSVSPLADHINRVNWPISNPPPLVSIIIPTRDRADLLRNCLAGLRTRTNYRSFEVLILDNDSVEPETLELFDELRAEHQFQIIPVPGPFNFSLINNAGVQKSRGEILVFLNNDIEIIGPDWLHELVANALRTDVGCVGARLLYADRTIQHAGIVFKPGPLAMHIFRRRQETHLGFDAQVAGTRTYLAVTAACLALRRSLFDRVQGFDELGLKVSFQDVDLCLKVEALGYRNVCTPFEPLLHLEGATRSGPASPEQAERERSELNCLSRRWSDRFAEDPFAHPCIDLDWERGEYLRQPAPMTLLPGLVR